MVLLRKRFPQKINLQTTAELSVSHLMEKSVANIIFQVQGPFNIPMHKGASSKLIAEDLSTFWEEIKEYKASIGCYVFAVRAGKGFTPLYVGKTVKSFEQECFTDHKINHYNYGLAEYSKCTPVMFLVTYPNRKRKVSAAEISDLEDFLIQVGRRVNPNLRNIRGAKEPTWGIKGVIRAGKGKANGAETNFKKVFGL